MPGDKLEDERKVRAILGVMALWRTDPLLPEAVA